MDGDAWKEQADLFARMAGEGLDAIERDAAAAQESGDFREVWRQIRELGEGIRTAPAIASPDKIALQRRLNAIVRAVRESQRALQRESQSVVDELNASLQLAAESISEATSVTDLEEVRADLALLRERVTALPPSFPRARRSQLWERWQELNRAAWSALVERWSAGEAELGTRLDDVEALLEAGQVRPAREAIRAFHEAMAAAPVSHRGARTLRGRANALWQRAAERGREQHEQYLSGLRGRLRRWRNVMRQNEHRREQLQGQSETLERQAATAHTEIAHALAVGQLAELRRAMTALDRESQSLAEQIADAEARLAEHGDSETTASE
jgi:hypothetical protein